MLIWSLSNRHMHPSTPHCVQKIQAIKGTTCGSFGTCLWPALLPSSLQPLCSSWMFVDMHRNWLMSSHPCVGELYVQRVRFHFVWNWVSVILFICSWTQCSGFWKTVPLLVFKDLSKKVLLFFSLNGKRYYVVFRLVFCTELKTGAFGSATY